MVDLKQLVIQEFSSEVAQRSYKETTKKGLWKSEEKLIKTYFKKSSSVLDIGCGQGRTTFPLAKMGYKVVGLDLTPAMIKAAKEFSKEFKINVNFVVGDATNLKFKKNSFDNALFSCYGWDQIPFNEDKLKALEEACRVIKPGGHFIFTSHIRRFGKWAPFWVKQWLRFYILKNMGFRIKEQQYGDRFFKRAGEGQEFEAEQYVHIPKLGLVKKQIKKAGFYLIYSDYRNSIAPEDKKLTTGNGVFFVCRKP